LRYWAFDNNVDGLIAAWREYKAGRYGLLFTHDFQVGCTVVGRNPHGSCNYEKSDWCAANRTTGLLNRE